MSSPDAIEKYKEDPFNPHAIARLRPNAYQKAIVLKYIDNLIDWGDDLFAQDTAESINEARMLYVLAASILGKRPVKVGKCDTGGGGTLFYDNRDDDPAGNEFLIYLENWILSRAPGMQLAFASSSSTGASSAAGRGIGGGFVSGPPATAGAVRHSEMRPRRGVRHYSTVTNGRTRYANVRAGSTSIAPVSRNPNYEPVGRTSLAFCVPFNEDLLKYWDRVEERLFRIRRCMNISGVRRELALFEQALEPMALVRSRAAGLSLEDILPLMAAPLPPYRFAYLIERAKQSTQTVQSFGSSLLSALEKKDVEELTLLRSVHERNILRMTKELRKRQVDEARNQFQAMIETETNVQNRITYYQDLIGEGTTDWETVQQVAKHTATGLAIAKGVLDLVAGIVYVLPQIGSPFAMKYGGKETGDSTAGFADWLGDLAGLAESISASAGLEATFQRRGEEWEQQLALAKQEKKQVEQQRLAAEVRQIISEKELELHERNMEQADELDEFYKGKFTELGLYNYLSTVLTRLYREAYNVAYDMAKTAERAFRFETDDETILIAPDNWRFDRAGLLAGEQLLLQLQRMEKAYIAQHTRDHEITHSFSLALVDPRALFALRETGSCAFIVPEVLFDLFYPGQYKRLLKSVRLTIPCVAGPYTNVGAKLTLLDSWLRKSENLTQPP